MGYRYDESKLIDLVEAGTDRVIARACRECRIVLSGKNGLIEYPACEHAATRMCDGCGLVPSSRCYTHCEACRVTNEAKREQERFDAAEKVPAHLYEGWVYVDSEIGHQEGYFESVDALMEFCEDEGEDVPAWAWTCDEIGMPKIDADAIIESALEEHHEDAADMICDLKGLQAFLDAWCAKQVVISHQTNYHRAVVLTPAEGLAADATREAPPLLGVDP